MSKDIVLGAREPTKLFLDGRVAYLFGLLSYLGKFTGKKMNIKMEKLVTHRYFPMYKYWLLKCFHYICCVKNLCLVESLGT